MTVPRRPGDPAALVADSSKIKTALGWAPQYSDIDSMLASAWQWELKKATNRQSSE